MASKRKILRLVVVVTVPSGMTAAQARREVRTLINDQTTYYADPRDVLARSVRPLMMGSWAKVVV